MKPVTPATASEILAGVDRSSQALRGLLVVQPDVLMKLPPREIQQAGATVLALVDELNAWFLEHMAVVPRAKNEAAPIAADSVSTIVELKSDLELIASGWRTDALTARVGGIGIQFGEAEADLLAELLVEAADAIGLLLRERGIPQNTPSEV